MPKLNSLDDLKQCVIDDFILDGYDPHPPIKAKMAV
jgi:thymidylate synthase